MAQVTPLDGSGAVELGDGYVLVAPDLVGTVEELSPEESVSRGDGGIQEPELFAALGGQDMLVMKVLELDIERDDAPLTSAGEHRAAGAPGVTRGGEEAIALQVPILQENTDTVLFYTDEAGTIRWIFPEESDAQEAGPVSRGNGATLTFLLPREGAEPAPAVDGVAPTRGRLTKLGRRIVRVISWVSDPLVGKGLDFAVTKWEGANRPYAFRKFPFDKEGDEPNWSELGKGRALLFLHGTFSNNHATYCGLADGTVTDLTTEYGGRIFGFDHPSLHDGPDENVDTFFTMLQEKLPAGAKLEVDVITHSRGGLVFRALDRAIAAGKTNGIDFKVRRAILVASPNRGTVLTTAEHGMDFIDRYTNLITDLPDNLFTYVLEGLLAVVKLAYHAAVNTLPGLMSMQPQGKFLATLNGLPLAATPEYHAIAANFSPKPGDGFRGLMKRVGDSVVDTCFEEDNDLVVPTQGGYRRSAAEAWIPDGRLLKMDKSAGVHHCSYFGHEDVDKKLVEWLRA